MFAYCLNNPVNMADTTGKLPFFLVTAAIVAVAGAIIGGVAAAKSGGNVGKTTDGYRGVNGSLGIGTATAVGIEFHGGQSKTVELTKTVQYI